MAPLRTPVRVTIRRARAGDGNTLLNSVRRSAEGLKWAYPYEHVASFEESYLNTIKANTVHVATVGSGCTEEIVGYIHYTVHGTSIGRKDKFAEIYGLYVHVDKQKLGAGTKLLQEAVKHIDMYALPIELEPRQPAFKLYQRNGFIYYKRLGYMIRPAKRRVADRCALYPMM